MPLYRLIDAGRYRFLTNPNDIYISKSLELYGEWSAGEIDLLSPYLKPGDTVIEVGANIGAHTVLLAHAVGRSGAVHAFEPQRLSFQLLNANVALNHCLNVHTHRLAVGRSAGRLRLRGYDPEKPGNFGGIPLASAEAGNLTAMVPLDALRAEIGAVTLLKLDVEGHEADVIAGATALIGTDRPVLYLENDRPDTAAALIEQVWALGYTLWWHVVPLFRPDNITRTRNNIFGKLVSINMLALPNESAPPQGLRKVETAAPFPLA